MAFFACRPDIGINQDFDIPQGDALRTSLDVENALQSGYAYLREPECYGGSWLLWPDLMADHVIHNPNTPYATPELAIYNRNLNPSDSLITKSWITAYRAIGVANAVLDALAKGSVGDEDFEANKQRFLGEAHFIRAITLFELVRFFAPQYSPESRNEKAIPVPTEAFTTVVYQDRKTVEEVYNQILQDLTAAANAFRSANLGTTRQTIPADLFPIGAGFPAFNRPNFHIAQGFRARVLMQMGESTHLSQAVQAINEVIEDRTDTVFSAEYFEQLPSGHPRKEYPNPYPLLGVYADRATLAPMFTNNSARGTPMTVDSRKLYEILFSFMNSRTDFPAINKSFYFCSRYSYNRLQPDFFNVPPPYVPQVNPRFTIYSGNTDKRVQAYFINNINTQVTINGQVRMVCNKFNNQIVNMPLLRSADLMLLRAEAYARLGQARRAAFDLLFVRFRANMANDLNRISAVYQVADENPAGMLDLIIKERQRELYLEGDRLHTLRRNRIDIPDAERGPGLPWNSPRLVFPIPTQEILSNPNLNK